MSQRSIVALTFQEIQSYRMSQNQALSKGTSGGTGAGKPGIGEWSWPMMQGAPGLILALPLPSCKALDGSLPFMKLSFLLLIIANIKLELLRPRHSAGSFIFVISFNFHESPMR